MRADEDGRVPVEAFWGIAGLGLRLDVDDSAGGPVGADEVALLPLGVDDVGIAGLHRRLVAIGEEGDEPVGVGDAVDAVGPDRAALGVVVLGASVDVVEGLGVVESEFVELSDRQVCDVAPAPGEIEALVETAVGAHEQPVGVIGTENEGVVVRVLGLLLEPPEVLAAVIGDLDPEVHEIDPVKGVRARHQLLVVVRARGAGHGVGALLPGRAAVGRTPDAAGGVVELDGGVEHIRLLRRDGQTDLAHVAFRQTRGKLHPGLTAIDTLVDPALGSAVDQGGHRALMLPGCGVEHIRVSRIHDDIGDSGPLARRQDVGPRNATVSRFEKSTFTTGGPEGTLGGDKKDFGVLRVDDDLGEVLRISEPHQLPAAAAVGTPVDSVAEADMAAADILTGAEPNDLRVGRVDGDATGGVDVLAVEDRLPGRPGVDGLPHSA